MSLVYGSENTFIVLSIKFKCFYFRVMGYGLWIGLRKKDELMFSERYGYTKYWQPFGDFRIKLLTK